MESNNSTIKDTSTDSPPPEEHWLNRNVIGMGATSFFSDACHEMSTVVLPGFLAVMGAPASALGIIEGAADAASSFIKLLGGWISDRFGNRKLIATLGYLVTGVSQSLFAFALTWHLVLIGRVIGWFGRGFRSPITKAMLSDSVAPAYRGKAFGIHRTADTIGAFVGPLIGIGLLSFWNPGNLTDNSQPFRNVFLITLIPGILSALVFFFSVKEKHRSPNTQLRFWRAIKSLPPDFRKYLLGVGIFGLGDFAPTLLILAATTLLTPSMGIIQAAQLAGMMYIVRNIIYAIVSYPIGALGDKIGRVPILVGGYLVAVLTILGFVCAFIFQWNHPALLFFLFALSGIYIAVEDTLENAITADLTSKEIRGIGMGVLGTVNGVGDFVASSMVGLLWTMFSPAFGLGIAMLLMLCGAIILMKARIQMIQTSA